MSSADAAVARRPAPGRTVPAAVAVLVVTSAMGVAWAPWLTAGAVLGAALIAVSMAWPAAVVTFLLFLGPLDLSFLTGGFKGLFAGLGGLDMNGIRLLAVTAGVGLALAADPAQRARFRSAPVAGYLLFLAWAGLSVAWSADPLEGLRLLVKMAWPLLIFLVVSAPGRTRADVDRTADWVLAGGALLVVFNPLFVVFGGDMSVDGQGVVRLGGAGVGYSAFSFYLLVVAAMALSRYVTRRRLGYLALAAGAGVWMALSLTRITVLAALVALTGVGLLRAARRGSLRTALAALGGAALLGAFLAPPLLARTFGFVPSPAEFLALARDPVGLALAMNWQGRLFIWGALLTAWASSPLVGLGLGSSTATLKEVLPDHSVTVAHNEYVRLGTDTGLVGVVLFAAAMLVWLAVVVRGALARGAADDGRLQELALPALAVVLALGVLSLTDNPLDYYGPFTQFAGFLVAGVAVAVREREGAA